MNFPGQESIFKNWQHSLTTPLRSFWQGSCEFYAIYANSSISYQVSRKWAGACTEVSRQGQLVMEKSLHRHWLAKGRRYLAGSWPTGGAPARPGSEGVLEPDEEGGGEWHQRVVAGSVNRCRQREGGAGTAGGRADETLV